MVNTSGGQGGKDLDHLKGVTVPVRLSGPFDNVSYKLELGSLVQEAAKAKIEAAVKDVEEALKGDDKATIEGKTDAMMAASHKLSEKMYADVQKSAAAQGASAGEAPQPAAAKSDAASDDNVVDADFKEVKT